MVCPRADMVPSLENNSSNQLAVEKLSCALAEGEDKTAAGDCSLELDWKLTTAEKPTYRDVGH